MSSMRTANVWCKALAAAATLAAGCTASGVPMTAFDSDAGDDGSQVLTDASNDAGHDAGSLKDAAVDARVSTDAGAPDARTSPDAAVVPDAACTSTVCCSIVPQSGCTGGQACRYQYAAGVRTGIRCEPAGDDLEGMLCTKYDAGGDSCAPGLFCSHQCRRSCETGDDCGPGQVCDPGGLAGPFCVSA